MKKTFLSFLFIWTLLSVAAQKNKIDLITDNFLNNPYIQPAVVGISVSELKTGKPVIQINHEKLFIPASTLKILYAFEVLNKYPDDFQWETKLLFTGNIQNDTLKGNVIIRSGGDPSFGGEIDTKTYSQLLDEMTLSLKSLGIKILDGNVELQIPANYYPAHGSWPVEDIGNYYGTGYWGFNYNDNTYKLYLKTGEIGQTPEIEKIEPYIPHLNIHNLAVTVSSNEEDTSYLYGDPTSFNRTLLGNIPQSDSLYVIKGGIPHPPLNFIAHFAEKLQELDIQIKGKIFVRPKVRHFKGENILWQHQSPPLIEIVKHTLNKSVNMYSEALARKLIEKKPVSDKYIDKDSLNEFFHLKGFRRIDLEDGSGLAPDNLIAPEEFTRFLKYQVDLMGLKKVLDILPHAGEDGYAKYFLKNSPLQKQIWLKSGSVSKVRNYAGIFRGKSGKYYLFAVMVNHFKGKHKPVKKALENYLENLILNL